MTQPSRALFAVPMPTEEQILEGERLLAEERERQAREAAAEARQRRSDALDRAPDCQLTERARAAIVSGSGELDTQALRAAKTWHGSPDALPWLTLAGGTGCGKSVAAAWTLAASGGLWVSAIRVLRLFTANFGEAAEEWDKLRTCRFLVLDDLGTETDSPKMAAALCELLDARKSSKRRTVVTANMNRKGFVERYASERLTSRLVECCEWVACTGSDLRRAK